MIEHGITKVGAVKLFGTVISPGFAVFTLSGIMMWKFWEHKQAIQKIATQEINSQKKLDNLNTKIEVLNAQKLELSRKLDNIQNNSQNRVVVNHDKNLASLPKTQNKKSGIFQQIIQENLALRKAIS